TSIDSTLNWSTTAAVQVSAAESLTVDSETRDWRLSIEHTFTDRIALRLQVPYRNIGAGSLDGFIDNWHAFFGLPEGDRPLLATNQFAIRYRRNNLTTLNVVRPQSGLGDVRLDAGYQLLATTSSAMSLWLGVKLPTSSDQSLASDSVDVSTGLATTRKLSSRWQTFGQVAVVHLGSGRVLPAQQREWLAHGYLGFDYLAMRALTLTLQLEGHSATFKNTSLDLLGNTWILAMGGDYRLANDWRVQLGVSEDVKVESSPDVTFVLSISKRL
ncbi:MAG: DUF3187 family protein, partial [Candidatus Obscuribacterales bacterium]|nr:DUF3187 family protein [Steroidobacteraceae bacterium]